MVRKAHQDHGRQHERSHGAQRILQHVAGQDWGQASGGERIEKWKGGKGALHSGKAGAQQHQANAHGAAEAVERHEDGAGLHDGESLHRKPMLVRSFLRHRGLLHGNAGGARETDLGVCA